MKMKKLALSMAVAAAMGATTAEAAVVSEYGIGVLVPNVIHTDGGTTAVGIISRRNATVFWTFFDEDSNHVTNGQFDVTANDFHSFIWENEAGVGLKDQRGYLVFVADTNKDGVISDADYCTSSGLGIPGHPLCLAGQVFAPPIAGAVVQVFPSTQDVAYVPAIPLDTIDLKSFPLSPTTLGADSLVYLVAGANCVASGVGIPGGFVGTLQEASIFGPYSDDIDMRYFIDGQSGGTDTKIVVWSARDISGTHTVNMFDDNQNRKSVNFDLPKKELNFVDVESINGRPANFVDGFIRWTFPCGKDTAGNPAPFNGGITYSEIDAPSFGAIQTIVNPFGPSVSP